jgi:hypothetical protein
MNFDEINDFDPNNQKLEVDIGLSLIRILESTHLNYSMLGSILKRQLELTEILKGRTKLKYDEDVELKLNDLTKTIHKIAHENYMHDVSLILKPIQD